MNSFKVFARKVRKKVNLLGDPAVGKTSLILRFVKNVFGEEYLKTIGTNVYKKKVPMTGAQVNLIIYDIMGERDFSSVQQSAFQGSTGAIAVADVTRGETLRNLVYDWLPKYRSLAKKNAPVILAINKDDLEDKEITEEYLSGKISESFDYYFFTSAKTGKKVDDAFNSLASQALFRSESTISAVEEILHDKRIDTSKKLLSGLLALTSEKGNMSHSDRVELLEEAGINKYALDERVSEEQVIDFAEKVHGWYKKENDLEAASSVQELVEKYRSESG